MRIGNAIADCLVLLLAATMVALIFSAFGEPPRTPLARLEALPVTQRIIAVAIAGETSPLPHAMDVSLMELPPQRPVAEVAQQ